MSPSCSLTRFPIRGENFSNSQTFKHIYDIGLKWPKMGICRGKIGEGVVQYWPNELVHTIGVIISDPVLVKIYQEMRPCECSRMNTHTDTPHGCNLHWTSMECFLIMFVNHVLWWSVIRMFWFHCDVVFRRKMNCKHVLNRSYLKNQRCVQQWHQRLISLRLNTMFQWQTSTLEHCLLTYDFLTQIVVLKNKNGETICF